MNLPVTTTPAALRARPWRRAALWGALVALLVVAQSLLVALTISFESNRAQERVEAASASVVADLKQALARQQQDLQALTWSEPQPVQWHTDATALLRTRREMLRVERRDPAMHVIDVVDSPFQPSIFTKMRRLDIDLESRLACASATRNSAPSYSRSYFVPLPNGNGLEVMDLCVPQQQAGQTESYTIATVALSRLLDEVVSPALARDHELSFVEADHTRLARVGVPRGAGVFVAEHLVNLPGVTLQLRVDSSAGSPRLIPNLAVALVLGLSLLLGVVVLLLARDVRRRALAEAALAEALAFRKAMEDSLITGLRARDTEGRITYVNPAFCAMVGYSAAELVGQTTPPYWPADLADDYRRRQAQRLGGQRADHEAREGFESTFLRRNGERLAVLIFEAPLVDGNGRHTGWMSAVLDVSAQQRMEELSRQQQERLQATARLATVGEMASLLSHELNQPLAAIASYAAGSSNLMKLGHVDAETVQMLQHASQAIADQAERAGRVIKSVHDFVRRREQVREGVRVDVLLDAVLPLVRLQARKSGTQISVDLPEAPLRVLCDRTMVEQVLLNLTRNAIQAMEEGTEAARRQLRIHVRQTQDRWISFSIIDQGTGVAPEVAQRLFTPFYTTRSEGMGLGLSLCRTVIEQHGGALDFQNLSAGSGTEFRFTLPVDRPDRGPTRTPGSADIEAESAADQALS